MAAEITREQKLDATALLRVKGRGELTTDAYRQAVRGFASSGLPLTVEGAAAYIDTLRGVSSASTVNKTLAALRLAFYQAGERLGLDAQKLATIRGALASIPGGRRSPPEVEVVTPEERAALLAALPLRVRLVAEVLYVTGARISEIVNVRRDQVRVNGSVELRLYGKGRKERTAKIPAALNRRILEEYPTGTYLFETGGGHTFHREYISREIARAARRVLGRAVSAHVLRHSRAMDLLASTHRIKAVSRLLGHADEAVTLRYYVKDSFTDSELFSGV
jgi:integrase